MVALVVLAQHSDRFFTLDNLLNQGRLMAEVGLVALAMTFVIITGGIDLSVGSILGLCAILLGVFWQERRPAAADRHRLRHASSARSAGFVNGFIITRFRVPPLIATLATLALYRGLAEGISQARSVRGYPEWFFVLGQGELRACRPSSGSCARRARRRGDPRLYALGPRRLCDRLERDGGALLRAAGRPHQAAVYTASGFAAASLG